MTKVITINERGTLTLPREMRVELGIAGSGQVVAESTKEGVLLRAGVTMPVEVYSKKRVADFKKEDQKLSPYRTRIEAALRGKAKRK